MGDHFYVVVTWLLTTSMKFVLHDVLEKKCLVWKEVGG